MVCDIDHLGDLRHGGLDRDFDPLSQRHVHLRTALAAAAQLDIRGAVAHLEQIDIATMRRHRWIDLPVENLLDAGRHRVAPAFAGVLDPKRATHDRRIEVDGRPVEVGRAPRLDQHPQIGCVDHEVTRRCVGGCDEVQLVDELAAAPAGNGDPQAGIGMAALRADAVDLGPRGRRHGDHGRHYRHSISWST